MLSDLGQHLNTQLTSLTGEHVVRSILFKIRHKYNHNCNLRIRGDSTEFKQIFSAIVYNFNNIAVCA